MYRNLNWIILLLSIKSGLLSWSFFFSQHHRPIFQKWWTGTSSSLHTSEVLLPGTTQKSLSTPFWTTFLPLNRYVSTVADRYVSTYYLTNPSLKLKREKYLHIDFCKDLNNFVCSHSLQKCTDTRLSLYYSISFLLFELLCILNCCLSEHRWTCCRSSMKPHWRLWRMQKMTDCGLKPTQRYNPQSYTANY